MHSGDTDNFIVNFGFSRASHRVRSRQDRQMVHNVEWDLL